MLNKVSSNRQLKASNLIKQSIIKILMRGKQLDLRLIENKITITDVKISPDLKQVTCYFIPFGQNVNSQSIIKALDASKYAIRKQVTEDVNLKYSPELRFQYDHGMENATKVDAMMKNLL